MFPGGSCAKCDTLSLIYFGPWDSLHLLLFICQCHLHACLARLFADSGAWSNAWHNNINSQRGAAFAKIIAEEVRACRKGLLQAYLEPHGVCKTLLRTAPRPHATALTVRLDGVVDDAVLDGEYLFNGSRPSRRGVRLLGRAAVACEASCLFMNWLYACALIVVTLAILK